MALLAATSHNIEAHGSNFWLIQAQQGVSELPGVGVAVVSRILLAELPNSLFWQIGVRVALLTAAVGSGISNYEGFTVSLG